MSRLLINILKWILMPMVVVYIMFNISLLFGWISIIVAVACFVFIKRTTFYVYIANKQYSKGNSDKAIDYYKKASEQKGASLNIKVLYGYLLLKNGNIDESDRVLNKLLNGKLSNEDTNMVKSNIALVLWKKGQLQDAVAMLEEVVTEYKTTNVYASLGYLLIKNGDLNRALQINKEAYEYNNTNAIILDNLAQTYFVTGDIDNAKRVYIELMEQKPSFPEAYYNYATFLKAEGDNQRAYEYAIKAKEYKLSYTSTITENEISSLIRELQEAVGDE